MIEVADSGTEQVHEKTATFRISGLDCYSCGLSLLTSLRKKDRVKDAMLNFFTSQMKVTYEGDEGTLKDVEEEIKKSGYHPMLQRR